MSLFSGGQKTNYSGVCRATTTCCNRSPLISMGPTWISLGRMDMEALGLGFNFDAFNWFGENLFRNLQFRTPEESIKVLRALKHGNTSNDWDRGCVGEEKASVHQGWSTKTRHKWPHVDREGGKLWTGQDQRREQGRSIVNAPCSALPSHPHRRVSSGWWNWYHTFYSSQRTGYDIDIRFDFSRFYLVLSENFVNWGKFNS